MKSTSKMFKALFGGVILLLGFALVGQAAAQTWTELSPAGTPPAARHNQTTVFDPGSNRMIVFGGRSISGTMFNDVWVLTNANGLGGTPQWIQLAPATPSGAPTPRWVHGAGYNAANNTMIVFGGALGSSSPCVNDVWLLSNANGLGGTPTWMPLGTTGSVPGVRFNHLFVYVEALNRVIMAGGSNCFSWPYNGQAFTLTNANGLGGTPTWTNLAPAGFPSLPTHAGAHIYDPASDRLVNWGHTLPLNQLNILAGASGTTVTPAWSTLTLAAGPTTDANIRTAVYNSSSNRAVFFGGTETWRLQNANGVGATPSWSQVFPSGSTPPARGEHTAVYHAATDRMIIFGGNNGSIAFSDVWVLADAISVPFAAFTAKVEIELGPLANDDAFKVKANFTLDAGSDGIDPLTEDVSFQIGTFSTIIPAGSFEVDKKGRFKFEGVIGGVSIQAKITPLGATSFEFKVEGQGADLTGTVNPVTLGLTIGGDGGSTTVTAEFE